MSNHFTQRIPGGMDPSMEPLEFDFETQEELLNHEFIQRFKKEDFHQFSLDGKCLMVESNDGKTWWCLGYLSNPEEIDLPKWEPHPETVSKSQQKRLADQMQDSEERKKKLEKETNDAIAFLLKNNYSIMKKSDGLVIESYYGNYSLHKFQFELERYEYMDLEECLKNFHKGKERPDESL